jgi:hypothetical protein
MEIRFVFEGGGQTGVRSVEDLADALSSRPLANRGDLFIVEQRWGGERKPFKSNEELDLDLQNETPEWVAGKCFAEAETLLLKALLS